MEKRAPGQSGAAVGTVSACAMAWLRTSALELHVSHMEIAFGDCKLLPVLEARVGGGEYLEKEPFPDTRAGSSGWKSHSSRGQGLGLEGSSDVKRAFLSLAVPANALGPFPL